MLINYIANVNIPAESDIAFPRKTQYTYMRPALCPATEEDCLRRCVRSACDYIECAEHFNFAEHSGRKHVERCAASGSVGQRRQRHKSTQIGHKKCQDVCVFFCRPPAAGSLPSSERATDRPTEPATNQPSVRLSYTARNMSSLARWSWSGGENPRSVRCARLPSSIAARLHARGEIFIVFQTL